MVDDPSAVPEEFPTDEAQENEQLRLFALISELVTWENTTNEQVLNRAREEIKRSWRRACTDNADHPEAAELFDPNKLPGFHDPFAGGGALPLEAQRLGLESYASDLSPVAVLINKAMIEMHKMATVSALPVDCIADSIGSFSCWPPISVTLFTSPCLNLGKTILMP